MLTQLYAGLIILRAVERTLVTGCSGVLCDQPTASHANVDIVC
jgi:hypothetical protein